MSQTTTDFLHQKEERKRKTWGDERYLQGSFSRHTTLIRTANISKLLWLSELQICQRGHRETTLNFTIFSDQQENYSAWMENIPGLWFTVHHGGYKYQFWCGIFTWSLLSVLLRQRSLLVSARVFIERLCEESAKQICSCTCAISDCCHEGVTL